MAPTDERFARLQTDPRFRRPKQKQLKAEIDERFKDALSEDFGKVASKDKHGRKLGSTSGTDSMKRFYRMASPEGGEARIDYARGAAELESSGSEDESESEDDEEEVEVGAKQKVKYIPSDSESEDEGHLRVNLDEEDDGELEMADAEEEEEEEEGADPTSRIAAVNLDWDHLRASDMFTIFNSFLKSPPVKDKSAPPPPPPGKLLSVRIYPSEFGKERMAMENEAGPGGGLWRKFEKAKGKRAREDDDEESGSDEDEAGATGKKVEGSKKDAPTGELEDDGLDIDMDDLEIVSDAGSEDIDMDQLRKYQLERLRYYYAIATFSNPAAAELVHDELNGTEFERTANILDLSYVPEEMEFAEDEVHDECTKEPKGYKGNEFVTDALRHSKVKLTWDQDDPNRAKMTRRALTQDEIEAEDFANLVAASSDEDEESDDEDEGADGSGKKSKKALAKERKEKLRAMLLAGGDQEDLWGKAGRETDAPAQKKKGGKKDDDDLEITFRPGLSTKASATADGDDDADEDNLTTLEKYQRRMKEKKARRKEKAELKKAVKGGDGSGDEAMAGGDDFFGDDSSDDDEEEPVPVKKGKSGKDKDSRKGKGKGKADDDLDMDAPELVDDPTRHFDLKDMMAAEKAEKASKRKRKHRKAKGEPRELELGPDGFAATLQSADPRFAAVVDEPAFAIDPTHPKFRDTQANRAMLARARDKHAKGRDATSKSAAQGGAAAEQDLGDLVASVKSKMSSRPRKRHRKH